MTSEPAPEHLSPDQGRVPSSPFFRWLRDLGITRSADRWLGGVTGGVAQRTGLDRTLVRGLVVALALFGGIGVLLYGLAWALLPEPDGRIHAEEAGRGTWTSGMTGAVALVVAGLLRPGLPLLGDDGDVFWTLFWVGGLGALVYWFVDRRRRSGPPSGTDDGPAPRPPGSGPGFPPTGGPDASRTDPAPPGTSPTDGPTGGSDTGFDTGADRGPGKPGGSTARIHPLPYQPDPTLTGYDYDPSYSATSRMRSEGVVLRDTPTRPVPPRPSGPVTALLVGAATTVAGALLVLDRAGVLPLTAPIVVAMAGAAILLTLGMIGLGLSGRRSGLVGFAATGAVAGMLVSSFAVVGGSWVVAQNGSSTPGTPDAATSGYSVLASQYRIDLTDLPTQDTVVPVTALASNLTVVVPDDVPVEVRARTVLGRTDVPGDVGGTASSDGSTNGLLDLRDRTMNPETTGSTLVLDVRGAFSNITVRTESEAASFSSSPAVEILGTGGAR